MSSNSASNNRTSAAQKPSKNELKTRILNSILSRFSNNSSPTRTTTCAKKSSSTTPTDNSIQKFSDKRIADLINPNTNNSKIAPPPKPTVNYSINESRLREITHTPYPNQMFYPCNNYGNQLPLIKPVALRPKKFDTTYDSSSSSFCAASPTVVSHSFRLSAQEQQWTYELNSNTQRNSRFINRRSTIARSEYSETPTVTTATNQAQKPASAQVEAAKPSQAQPQQQHYHSMMMRPRLNLIKMKIHNLIENKPAANFNMIQELKEKQIEHQRKFQIPNVNSSSTTNNNSTKFEMLLNNINNTANTNNNSSSATTNSNSNGSLISLTSSTSSLLSSSSTSSLTSAVYSGGDDDSNSLSFDKFGPNEPKIDLDLIENDNEL